LRSFAGAGAGALVVGAGALEVGAGALEVGAGALVVGLGALVVGWGALVVGAGALVVGVELEHPDKMGTMIRIAIITRLARKTIDFLLCIFTSFT